MKEVDKEDKLVQEAAKNSDKSKCKHFRRENTRLEVYDSFEEGFIVGAKWQQERDKDKYSEEEVINILITLFSEPKDAITYFEQFKKKQL